MQLPPIGNAAPSAPRMPESGALVADRPTSSIKPAAQPHTVDAAEENGAAPTSPPLVEALRDINKTMETLGQDLEFSIDEDSKRTIVKVIDQRTQELIRQMPSAEALEIAKALDRVQGLLIRQKA